MAKPESRNCLLLSEKLLSVEAIESNEALNDLSKSCPAAWFCSELIRQKYNISMNLRYGISNTPKLDCHEALNFRLMFGWTNSGR